MPWLDGGPAGAGTGGYKDPTNLPSPLPTSSQPQKTLFKSQNPVP